MKPHEPQHDVAQSHPRESLNGNGAGEGIASAGSLPNAGAGTRAMPADQKRKILRKRARMLAQRPNRGDTQDQGLEVIVFMLAEEKFAVEVRHVREVYPLKDLTPLPCTPSFVTGMINVRGQIISIVDVKEFFDLPRKEPTELCKVLIIKNHLLEFGIISDAIVGEQKIPLEHIQSDMPALRGIREEYVRGVTHEPLVILDAERLLSDDRIIVHQEIGD